MSADLNCADMDKHDQLLILGSDRGVIRILDVSNPNQPKLLKNIKLFKNKPISYVQFNKDNRMFVAGSNKSRKIFFINANKDAKEQEKSFNIIGYSECPGKVQGISWNFSNKSLVGNNPNIVFVVLQYFLVTVVAPFHDQSFSELKLEHDVCP